MSIKTNTQYKDDISWQATGIRLGTGSEVKTSVFSPESYKSHQCGHVASDIFQKIAFTSLLRESIVKVNPLWSLVGLFYGFLVSYLIYDIFISYI